jgi:hypothetical protein
LNTACCCWFAAPQVPGNILFLYTGGPILLGVIAIAWGVAAAAQAAISSRTSFLLVRLFLGLAEAGTVPGALSSCS